MLVLDDYVLFLIIFLILCYTITSTRVGITLTIDGEIHILTPGSGTSLDHSTKLC